MRLWISSMNLCIDVEKVKSSSVISTRRGNEADVVSCVIESERDMNEKENEAFCEGDK